jgi:hypothetical protein
MWKHYIIIQLTPHWGFSVTDYIKYYDYLYVSLDHLSLQQWEYDITFLTVFILTHPANFALWDETGAKHKIQLPWKHLNCNP